MVDPTLWVELTDHFSPVKRFRLHLVRNANLYLLHSAAIFSTDTVKQNGQMRRIVSFCGFMILFFSSFVYYVNDLACFRPNGSFYIYLLLSTLASSSHWCPQVECEAVHTVIHTEGAPNKLTVEARVLQVSLAVCQVVLKFGHLSSCT